MTAYPASRSVLLWLFRARVKIAHLLLRQHHLRQ